MLSLYGPGGARDHVCARRLAQEAGGDSGRGFRCYLTGTNAMLQRASWTTQCPPGDFAAAAATARDDGVTTALISDTPSLMVGVTEAFRAEGITVLGPDRHSAALEGHKGLMKRLVAAAGVRTPESWYFETPDPALDFLRNTWTDARPLVVKTDEFITDGNLRSMVPDSLEEAVADVGLEVRELSREHKSRGIVVEERISGFETSVHVLWDGEDYLLFPPVRDYKPVGDGDTGPNTNGAAALACGRGFDPALDRSLRAEIIEPVLGELARAGYAYRGFLYFGIMLTADGPAVLELNVRPGSPEIVALLGLLDSAFADLVDCAAQGKLAAARPVWKRDAYCGTVFALADGYPETNDIAPVRIEGLDALADDGGVICEGVAEDAAGAFVVSAGRVATTVATAPTVEQVRDRVYGDLDRIRFEGKHQRNDLGYGIADGLFATA